MFLMLMMSQRSLIIIVASTERTISIIEPALYDLCKIVHIYTEKSLVDPLAQRIELMHQAREKLHDLCLVEQLCQLGRTITSTYTENELGSLLARDSGITRPECACI